MKINKKTDTALYIAGWFLILFCAALLAVFHRYHLQLGRLLPPCLFHAVTGLYCPGCGGTRAVLALLDGDVARSFRFHPLIPTTAAAAGWFMASQTAERLSGGRLKIGMHFREIYLWAALLILAVNFLVKNIAHIVWQINLMPA